MARLLIVEYVTASGVGIHHPHLQYEAQYMLNALLNDAISLGNKTEVAVLYHVALPTLSYPVSIFSVDTNFHKQWLQALAWAEQVFIIAPEQDYFLYQLTQEAHQAQCEVLSCSAEFIAACTDKYYFYQLLHDNFPFVIPTYRYPPLNTFKNKEYTWIIKPREGVGCEHTYYCTNIRELNQYQHQYREMIIQPYITGTVYSACILCQAEQWTLLCINQQYVEKDDKGQLFYRKFSVNINEPLLKKSVSQWLPQLSVLLPVTHGYIGLDFIVDKNKVAWLLEINPRFTTSYAALQLNNKLSFLDVLLSK